MEEKSARKKGEEGKEWESQRRGILSKEAYKVENHKIRKLSPNISMLTININLKFSLLI